MWVRIKSNDQDSIESDSLAAHVALHKERDAGVDLQFEAIIKRQEAIETRERELKSYLLKTISGAAIAIISSIVSITLLVIDHIK